MPRKLIRLTEKLAKEPQLITASAANDIFEFLNSRNIEDYQAIANANNIERSRRDDSILRASTDSGVAIINIDGPLSYQVTGIDAFCGAVSYEDIEIQFNKALGSPDIKTILLYINSPGGEAYGSFELAKYMRRKADEGNKKLITYIDGEMHSAALVLGIVSHEVISNPFSYQGSIGVMVKLTNTHKLKKKMGLEELFIFAGKDKIPFDKNGDFKESFIEDVQSKVDSLYSIFVSHVATFTKLTEEAVRGTEAKSFSSQEALQLGLIDKVMEREEFFNYLADFNRNAQNQNNISALKQKSDEDSEIMSNDNKDAIASLEKKLEELSNQLELVSRENSQLRAEKEEKELTQLKEKFSSYSFVKDAEKLVAVASKLDESEKAGLFSVLDAAKADLAKLNSEIESLKEKNNADLFKQVGGSGENEDLDTNQAKVKSQVSQNIKKLTGDNK